MSLLGYHYFVDRGCVVSGLSRLVRDALGMPCLLGWLTRIFTGTYTMCPLERGLYYLSI